MIDTDAVVGGEAASCFVRVVVAKLPVAGVRALAEAAQVGSRAVSGVQGVPVVIRRRFGQDEAEEAVVVFVEGLQGQVVPAQDA